MIRIRHSSALLRPRSTAVFVFTPQEMIGSLNEETEELVAAGHLNPARGNARIVRLEAAIASLAGATLTRPSTT